MDDGTFLHCKNCFYCLLSRAKIVSTGFGFRWWRRNIQSKHNSKMDWVTKAIIIKETVATATQRTNTMRHAWPLISSISPALFCKIAFYDGDCWAHVLVLVHAPMFEWCSIKLVNWLKRPYHNFTIFGNSDDWTRFSWNCLILSLPSTQFFVVLSEKLFAHSVWCASCVMALIPIPIPGMIMPFRCAVNGIVAIIKEWKFFIWPRDIVRIVYDLIMNCILCSYNRISEHRKLTFYCYSRDSPTERKKW